MYAYSVQIVPSHQDPMYYQIFLESNVLHEDKLKDAERLPLLIPTSCDSA